MDEEKLIPDPQDTEDDEDSVVVLTDEDGKDVEFQYVTTLERDGDEYVVLLAPESEEQDEDDGDVVILKIETDENGEETFVSIEDQELADSLFEEFIESIDEEDEDEA